MLRFVLLILFAANLGYAAWGQGWLTAVGWGPSSASEPWRLEKQMRPEAVQLLNGAASPTPAAAIPAAAAVPAIDTTEPASTESPAPATVAAAPEAATQCLEAGPFTQEETKTLRGALRAQELPWDSYELRSQEVPGRWMVYLGKFPSPELLARQRASLRAQGIDTDRAGGNLEPGLSLGRFSSEDAATRELTRLLRSGVRGARVVQERATAQLFTLRLPAVTDAQQPKLAALASALAGKNLHVCEDGD